MSARGQEAPLWSRKGNWKGAHQMGILELFDHLDVLKLDVQVLVNGLESSADLNFLFQLNRDLLLDKSLEEAVFPACC